MERIFNVFPTDQYEQGEVQVINFAPEEKKYHIGEKTSENCDAFKKYLSDINEKGKRKKLETKANIINMKDFIVQ